ncbi:MAG: hypothetical protein C4522_09020 [Desulfobacteraceae bacterium]|nr:MAG: hypothetical protein C4522_09020 [Desulfobacteraceae bacterium]
MTPHELNHVSQWKTRIPNPESIRMVVSNSHLNPDIRNFCETIASVLSITIQDIQPENELPGMTIHDRITYHAVPLGPELEPFLKALSFIQAPTNPVLEKMKSITVPVSLTLYITPQCPFCPAAVEKILPFVQAGDRIRITIIDGTLFPDQAKKDGIRSAPTLLFNTFRWTGNFQIKEVAELIADQNPSDLSTDTLKNIIHAGDAAKVADMMIQHNTIFPAFIDLLVHEKWPVRLGAMVVMERIIDASPELAAIMIKPVVDRFPFMDNSVKGDMIYLLGEAGDSRTIATLEGLLEDSSDNEISTITQEAIDSIRTRHDPE